MSRSHWSSRTPLPDLHSISECRVENVRGHDRACVLGALEGRCAATSSTRGRALRTKCRSNESQKKIASHIVQSSIAIKKIRAARIDQRGAFVRARNRFQHARRALRTARVDAEEKRVNDHRTRTALKRHVLKTGVFPGDFAVFLRRARSTISRASTGAQERSKRAFGLEARCDPRVADADAPRSALRIERARHAENCRKCSGNADKRVARTFEKRRMIPN